MERAERLMALGFGLLFDSLLMPVLWVMLVLTAITAVQRFVKVWRQAERPAARARAAPVARRRRPARTTERVKVRRERWAARCAAAAGSCASRARSGRSRSDRPWPGRCRARSPRPSAAAIGAAVAPFAGRPAGAGRAQPAAGPRRRPRRVRPAARRGGHLRASYARYWVESFRLPGHAAGGARRPA